MRAAIGRRRCNLVGRFAEGRRLQVAAAVWNFDDVFKLALRSVVTAIACFTAFPDSYSNAIAQAIGLGDDTDTVAAMAGAISGARLGSAAIPGHLLSILENGEKGREYITSLADRLAMAG